MDNTTSPQDKKKLEDYLAKIKNKRKKESEGESDGIDQFKESKKEDQNIKSYIEFVIVFNLHWSASPCTRVHPKFARAKKKGLRSCILP